MRACSRLPGECSMWLEFIYKNPNRSVVDSGCLLSFASFRVRVRQIFIPHSRMGGGYQQFLMHGMHGPQGGSEQKTVASGQWTVISEGERRDRDSGFGLQANTSISFISLISFVSLGKKESIPSVRSVPSGIRVCLICLVLVHFVDLVCFVLSVSDVISSFLRSGSSNSHRRHIACPASCPSLP